MTRRTRGISLLQLIEEVTPYLIGWRGYFDFCQTPRMIHKPGGVDPPKITLVSLAAVAEPATASTNCAVAAYRSSMQRSPRVRRRGPGTCPDTRRSKGPPTPCLWPSLTRSNRRDT